MRKVTTRPPSFPEAAPNTLFSPEQKAQWQVICGDRDHWRVGLYMPKEASRADVHELERHDCPELFLLLSGALTLVVSEHGAMRELPLEIGRPTLITAPHSGYCPGGPHTGVALVVERDSFDTEYRDVADWA